MVRVVDDAAPATNQVERAGLMMHKSQTSRFFWR